MASSSALRARRHCTRCRRWRLTAIDFSVMRWTDSARTRPRAFQPHCKHCIARAMRERSRRRREQRGDHRELRHAASVVVERSRTLPDFYYVDRVLGSLAPEQRASYLLEGCLPIVQHCGVSLAEEDYDPEPVPRGCHDCWRRDGGDPCLTCPSPPTARERRARGAYRVALPA